MVPGRYKPVRKPQRRQRRRRAQGRDQQEGWEQRIQNCITHGYRDGRTQSYWNLLIGICVVQSPFKKFGRSLCILVLTTLQNPDTQI